MSQPSVSLDLDSGTTESFDRAEDEIKLKQRRFVMIGGFALGLLIILCAGLLVAIQTRLLDDDFTPRWSPDGKRIVFLSTRSGDSEIYIMNADGSGVIRLTYDPAEETDPNWSPDGKQIVFAYGPLNKRQLYLMTVDTLERKQLTESHAFYSSPDWSPDGTKIAFLSDLGGSEQIYVIHADGKGVNKLTDTPGSKGAPTWSPDGTKIAFDLYLYPENPELYLMQADGSGVKQLTHNSSFNIDADWSPDGARIAFASGPGEGPHQIAVLNLDGLKQSLLPLPGNIVKARDPSWSPDGRRIAFTCYTNILFLDLRDVCVVNTDGTDLKQLTK